ncbi:hypothetical protein Dtox_4315 [Desulfofarcimen acetoxidans DSM 771]|jgi:hypothetical protein|uniref:Uncharacterized protein n=1 Tax=Desulfofarcimen acetoxidans (strain ATCC 49208 / DSM 771 / KCTC 5769 / VKM B-1644 / 5575) TaxID=485916 RepID=C8W011_DESAS|nr:hypothetical protein [Desulfofarcimen acetoxidans]ACV64979.1 hypothetical protein Dtox_4315 [Desulfofarcimen acetoxidans DSM 771]
MSNKKKGNKRKKPVKDKSKGTGNKKVIEVPETELPHLAGLVPSWRDFYQKVIEGLAQQKK